MFFLFCFFIDPDLESLEMCVPSVAIFSLDFCKNGEFMSTSWSKSETFRFLFADGVEFLRMHEFNNLSSETVSSSNDLSSEAELRSSSLSVEFETLALSFLLGFSFFDAGDGLRA
nr:hypothetical protein Iba_chr10bCG10020 [Ipomoea batatas]